MEERFKLNENLLETEVLKNSSLKASMAAQDTLRRVHAKDDEMPPIEAILASLKVELKLARQEEENTILDKMHRQKVAEVEKLGQTIRELKEVVLAGGASANVVRDYINVNYKR